MATPPLIEEDIQTLKRLGLTENQGKVFLALERVGISSARTISKVSGVTREKVYTVLISLQEEGLVRKAISAPLTFEAIPLRDAINFLLNRKLNDYKNLRARTTNLFDHYIPSHRDISQIAEQPELMLIPQKTILRSIRECIENSELSVDVVTTWKRFSRILLLLDALKKPRTKGARVRFVIQAPKDPYLLRDLIQLTGIPSSQFKTISSAPAGIVGLYDQKKVLFFLTTTAGLKDSPAVVTNIPSFVEIAKIFFEKMWITGRPYKEKLTGISSRNIWKEAQQKKKIMREMSQSTTH